MREGNAGQDALTEVHGLVALGALGCHGGRGEPSRAEPCCDVPRREPRSARPPPTAARGEPGRGRAGPGSVRLGTARYGSSPAQQVPSPDGGENTPCPVSHPQRPKSGRECSRLHLPGKNPP